MSLAVMIVVLFAASLHASWNFLVKGSRDKHLSMSTVVLGHTPFALVALSFAPLPSLESLLYILGGAMLHVGYQLFLLASYRIGDLSQVYPLARQNSGIKADKQTTSMRRELRGEQSSLAIVQESTESIVVA